MAEYSPGLAGVPAAETHVCYLDGTAGKLQYRGYPIEVLADACTFEEVAYLLLFESLPTVAQLDAFNRELVEARTLPARLRELLSTLPKEGHPMDALGAALCAAATLHPGDHVGDAEHRRNTAVRLVGLLPSIVAGWHRIRRGDAPVEPDPSLGHAENFLYMLEGERPDPLIARVLDVALILHAEHSMNASTFAARVVGSTLADLYTTISAAVGALSGRLHGGANERVLSTLRGIEDDSPEGIRVWVENKLSQKAKIMGFGHRVYKVKDPRAMILQDLAGELFEKFGRTPLYDTAVRLEESMTELVGDKGIYPNVDFYSGIVYEKMGIPTDLFTPVFAIARVSGWLAHLLEQLDNNRIFRPRGIWTGDADRALVPIADR